VPSFQSDGSMCVIVVDCELCACIFKVTFQSDIEVDDGPICVMAVNYVPVFSFKLM
jgi:hypothetical protein